MTNTLFTDAELSEDEIDYPGLDPDRHELEFCGVCGVTLLDPKHLAEKGAEPFVAGLLPGVVRAVRLVPHRGAYRWVPLCGGCWDGVRGSDTIVTGEDG
jgi:hypothetical protein